MRSSIKLRLAAVSAALTLVGAGAFIGTSSASATPPVRLAAAPAASLSVSGSLVDINAHFVLSGTSPDPVSVVVSRTDGGPRYSGTILDQTKTSDDVNVSGLCEVYWVATDTVTRAKVGSDSFAGPAAGTAQCAPSSTAESTTIGSTTTAPDSSTPSDSSSSSSTKPTSTKPTTSKPSTTAPTSTKPSTTAPSSTPPSLTKSTTTEPSTSSTTSTQPTFTPVPVPPTCWDMPNGGTAHNVTWPQTLCIGNECGVTQQWDYYTIDTQAKLDYYHALLKHGILNQGGSSEWTDTILAEDSPQTPPWYFVTTKPCVITSPPTSKPTTTKPSTTAPSTTQPSTTAPVSTTPVSSTTATVTTSTTATVTASTTATATVSSTVTSNITPPPATVTTTVKPPVITLIPPTSKSVTPPTTKLVTVKPAITETDAGSCAPATLDISVTNAVGSVPMAVTYTLSQGTKTEVLSGTVPVGKTVSTHITVKQLVATKFVAKAASILKGVAYSKLLASKTYYFGDCAAPSPTSSSSAVTTTPTVTSQLAGTTTFAPVPFGGDAGHGDSPLGLVALLFAIGSALGISGVIALKRRPKTVRGH